VNEDLDQALIFLAEGGTYPSGMKAGEEFMNPLHSDLLPQTGAGE
jgi:hypothetical protein